MNRIRRTIAVFLILAVAPSLALAAMSVRYCKGAVTHQALEFVVEGVAHGNHEASYHAVTDAAALSDQDEVAQISDSGGCADISLIDLASMPPMGQLQLVAAPIFQQHVSIQNPFLVFPHPSSVPALAIRQTRTDPRVSVRYTVVLRI